MAPLVGIVGIVVALYVALSHDGSGGFKGYLDPTGLILIGVGPPAVMLLSHGFTDFLTGIRLLGSSTFSRLRKHQGEVIDTLTEVSKAVRSEGLGAVLRYRDNCKYPLLRDGLSLIINDFKTEEIRHNLMARINAKQSHMQMSANLFENMSKVSPGIGMIGTLIGLIGMLSNMSDPSKIGSNMALAMVTTLYGLVLGTIIYAPWSEKIALEAEKSLEIDLLVVEGVLNVKGKKSSVHLKDLMKTYGKGEKVEKSVKADQSKKGA